MAASRASERHRCMCKRAATVFCVWALSCPLVTVPSSALSSASAIGDSDRAGESLGLPGGSRRALRHAEGTDARKHAAAPPPPPHHSGLTEALPPSLRQSVIAGVSAESSNTAGIEAASASLSLEGQLNVYGPPELALLTEFEVPAAKLALFQTACYNPTIAGYENVTAAERAAAARALGITVPNWRAGETAYFNQNPGGNIDTNAYWLPCHRSHNVDFQQNNLNPPAAQWPFILYGDSLTEMWKGTQGCAPSSQRKGFDVLRQQYLSPLSNADGMSGEAGWNTMWRVLNGEAVAATACPKLFQVYSGTNDFAASHADAGYNCGPAYAPLVAHRTIAILEALRNTCPDAHFILRGLGPKTAGAGIWPNLFTVGNQYYNFLLKAYADATPNVHYLVCGMAVGSYGFLRMTVPGDLDAACLASPSCLASSLAQMRIDRTKLVDGIHPTKAGMEIQGRCMTPIVQDVLGWNSSSGTFIGFVAPPADDGRVGIIGTDGKTHYHSAEWYIREGLPVPSGVVTAPAPTPVSPAPAKPTAQPPTTRPAPKPSAAKPAAKAPPPQDGFPAVLGPDGQYHYHTVAWWLKNWYLVPGVPRPQDGHPAVLGPDGKWHFHTAAWWAKQT